MEIMIKDVVIMKDSNKINHNNNNNNNNISFENNSDLILNTKIISADKFPIKLLLRSILR